MREILSLSTSSPEETRQLGARLAPWLRVGDMVALSAPLGLGKTELARGLLWALAGQEIEVPSPSFALIQPYETTPPVLHMDLYRLEDPSEVLELGLDDGLQTGIVLVEWPEHGKGYLPTDALWVRGQPGPGAQDRVWQWLGDEAWAERLKEWM